MISEHDLVAGDEPVTVPGWARRDRDDRPSASVNHSPEMASTLRIVASRAGFGVGTRVVMFHTASRGPNATRLCRCA